MRRYPSFTAAQAAKKFGTVQTHVFESFTAAQAAKKRLMMCSPPI